MLIIPFALHVAPGACMMQPDICILTEYMAKGSIYRILHDENVHLSWDIRRRFALDAARGMNYLHTSDPIVIHRDLKSHNLLVLPRVDLPLLSYQSGRLH